tara:strand:+ start:17554 stop:18420 length:867 start_codon:yes stop_codon:yes gene_type:complete
MSSDIKSMGGQEPHNNGFNNEKREYDKFCLDAFINEVGSEITGACMVPINIPEQEVKNIIKRAVKWFRKNYEYSLRENYVHIPNSVFKSTQFKRDRSLHFPKENPQTGAGEIFSIYGVYDLASGWNSAAGGLDHRFQGGSDFSIEKMLFRNSFDGMGPAEGAEDLQYYVINQSYFDLARQILENPISYNYSQLTGQLKFMGDTPKGDVILECYESIENCALYEDEIFFRYVCAQVKISIGSKLSVFKFTLPGGVEIDYDGIRDMGTDDMDKILEEIKGDEGVDWMMHS